MSVQQLLDQHKHRSQVTSNLLNQIDHLLNLQKMSMFQNMRNQQSGFYEEVQKTSLRNTNLSSPETAESSATQQTKLNLLQAYNNMILDEEKIKTRYKGQNDYLVTKHTNLLRQTRATLLQPIVEEQKSQSNQLRRGSQASYLTKEEISLAREYFNRLVTLRGLPLWIVDQELHEKEFDLNLIEGTNDWSYCCYNHAIGLPKKFGLYFPLHDYEIALLRLQLIENHRRIALLKSRGLGGTELALRKMSWLCLYNDLFNFSQMALVTGTRQDFAVDLMIRLKTLFLPRLNIIFPYSDQVCYLNKVKIKTYPAHKLYPLRGQPNMSYILADEADFYLESLQQELWDIIIGYIFKSDPLIDLISTAGMPYGLFYKLEHTDKEKRAFTFVKYDYRVGLNKIYRQREIDFVFRTSPQTASRELELNYGYQTGRLFSQYVIEMIKRFGEAYRPVNGVYHPPIISRYSKKVLIGDPAYGETSKFATLILEFLADYNCIRVIHAEVESMEDQDYMKNKMLNLFNEFAPQNVYIDGWWAGLIKSLRKDLGDPTDAYIIDEYEKQAEKNHTDIENDLIVIGKYFSNNTRQWASYAKIFLETEGYFACDPEFTDLLADMSNAELRGGKLVKTSKNPRDLTDTLLMGLQYFNL